MLHAHSLIPYWKTRKEDHVPQGGPCQLPWEGGKARRQSFFRTPSRPPDSSTSLRVTAKSSTLRAHRSDRAAIEVGATLTREVFWAGRLSYGAAQEPETGELEQGGVKCSNLAVVDSPLATHARAILHTRDTSRSTSSGLAELVQPINAAVLGP